jgi:hypothetical protein
MGSLGRGGGVMAAELGEKASNLGHTRALPELRGHDGDDGSWRGEA